MLHYVYRSHSLGHRRIGIEILSQKQPKDKCLPILLFPISCIDCFSERNSDSNECC